MLDPRLGPRSWGWAPAAFVALATILAFLPGVFGDFVGWDDDRNFVHNPHYRGLGWAELKWMWTSAHMGHWIPLTWLTLGLDYTLWGMDARGYHLTSLLLHAATALAVYGLARRLLHAALPAGTGETGLRLGAAAAALFFAVHPLRVESVAWVTERRDVLSGLFYVSTLWAYLRAVEGRDRPRRGWYWAAVGLFGCALLSKSLTVSLPVALLVLDIYPLRRLGGTPGWWRPRVWLEKVPFVLLAGLVALVAFQALRALGNMQSLADMGLGARVLTSLYGLGFYLWKTALPIRLSPLYELSTVARMGWQAFLPPASLVLVLTALAIVGRRRWPAFSAAWIVYVATLVPVLGFFQNGPQIAADRYTYLACLGWAILAGGGIARIADRAAVRGRTTPAEGWGLGGATVAIVVLVGLTSWQTLVWRDSLTLWSRAVALDASSAWAHAGLGFSHLGSGEIEEAIPHYREAVRLDPRLPEGLIGLAVGLSLTGHAEEAIPLARRAVTRGGGNAIFSHELGEILRRAGRREEALEAFREASHLEPRWATSRYALAVTLAELGRRHEAMASLEEAQRLMRAQDPGDPEGERFAALVHARFDATSAIAAWRRYVEALGRTTEPSPRTVRKMEQALVAIEELRAGGAPTPASR